MSSSFLFCFKSSYRAMVLNSEEAKGVFREPSKQRAGLQAAMSLRRKLIWPWQIQKCLSALMRIDGLKC